MAARRKTKANAGHSPSLSPAVAIIGIIVGVVLTLVGHYPGAIFTWLFITVAAWLNPRAEMTGKKDANGYPTPAHAGEVKSLRRYRFWSDLKWRMFTPSLDWWFGWPVYASTLIAFWVAGIAWYFDSLIGPVSAVFAYITFAQVSATRRRNSPLGEPCPGTAVGKVKSAGSHLIPFGWRAGAGALTGGIVLYLLTLIPYVSVTFGWVGWVLAITGGSLLAVQRHWSNTCLASWRELVAARQEWKPRWEMLKQEPAPSIVSREHVGDSIVDTFDAPGNQGAIAFYGLAPKILPTIGTNTMIFILPTENINADGQPIQGTQHPLRFRIVTMTQDGMPDLTDMEITEDEVRLALECGVVGTLMEMGAAAPVIGSITNITDTSPPVHDEEDEFSDEELATMPPDIREAVEAERAESSMAQKEDIQPYAAWAVEVLVPNGPPLKWIHTDATSMISGRLGCEVIVDWRDYGRMFVGSLTDPAQNFIDYAKQIQSQKKLKDLPTTFHNLETEAAWMERWEGVLKTTVNFPAIEHDQYYEYKLKNGSVIYSQSFVTLRGDELSLYFGHETKLATALEHMPFVSTVGFLIKSQRRGERHPQAFTVLWSNGNIPASPDTLQPSGKPGTPTAELCVLRGRVNEAFKAAKLPQPEVFNVVCLTSPRSRGHIWKIYIRLYGGVTLSDVRGAAQRIKQSWGCPWLRVTESPNGDGIIIIAGANPTHINPADETVRPYLTSLDWEQAWLDAKISGVGGLVPKLKKVDVLPDNDIVQVLDFQLPSGLSLTEMKAARSKLEATTANAYVEVRPHPNHNPADIQLYVAKESPMPSLIEYDFDFCDTTDRGIPFATGIEGRPICLDLRAIPHLLLAGSSGSGKSVSAQGIMYGAIVQGAQVVVVDIQKSGADFKFAESQAAAFVTDIFEAEAAMKAVYAEVKKRATANGLAGVGHSSELADPPLPIVVFIDEFLGVIMSGKKPSNTPEDDHQLEAQRLENIRIYQAKKQIAFISGRIAAEARSADVHLILMTQKLVMAMLDDDLRDIKDLTLDTLLPVPVSPRFPNGWARNDELELGDLLYTPSGITTPIIKFSDTFADNEVFAVTFEDGQVVKAGGGHLWQASSNETRRTYSARNKTRAPRIETIQWVTMLAQSCPADLYMTPSELADLTGYASAAKILRLSNEFDLERYAKTADGKIASLDRTRGRGSAGLSFKVSSATNILKTTRIFRDVSPLAPHQDMWMTARVIAETLDGNSGRSNYISTLLNRGGCPTRKDGHAEIVYHAGNFLTALGSELRNRMGTDPRTGEPLGAERIITTAEMAADPDRTWAIHVTEPLDGPDLDLPVDPYVLGAWLGDGCKGAGNIISSAAESCTDVNGLTDQAHMLDQLSLAGVGPHVLDCSDIIIGTYGLLVKLRELGVLHDKHIPAIYLRASKTQRLALLQGLMDTDGSLTKNGQCVLPQVSRRIARGALELARSLGLKVSWSEYDARYTPTGATEPKITGTVHNLSFRTSMPVFRLPRKRALQATPVEDGRTTRRTIVSIERIATEPTRCIGVEDDGHLFLVEGFIPTHNTNLARILIGKTNSGDRMSALRDAEAAPPLGNDIPKGRGIWESTMEAAQMAQFWFAPASTYERELAARVPAIDKEHKINFESFMVKADPEKNAIFGERIEKKASRIVEPVEVELGVLDFDLDLEDVDSEPVDLSALGIQIIGDDEPQTGISDDIAGLNWGTFTSDIDNEETDNTNGDGMFGPDFAFATTDEETVEKNELNLNLIDLPYVADEDSIFGWGVLDSVSDYLEAHPDIRVITWDNPTLFTPLGGFGETHEDIFREIVSAYDVEFVTGKYTPSHAGDPNASFDVKETQPESSENKHETPPDRFEEF